MSKETEEYRIIKTSSKTESIDPRVVFMGLIFILQLILLFAAALLFDNPLTTMQLIFAIVVTNLLNSVLAFLLGGYVSNDRKKVDPSSHHSQLPQTIQNQLPVGLPPPLELNPNSGEIVETLKPKD